MRRVAVSLVALTTLSTGVAIGIGDRAAWACSCVPSTPAEHAARADVVFTGTLTEVSTPRRTDDEWQSPVPVTLMFKVHEVLKGEATEVQEVLTTSDGASCGLGNPPLGDYIVYASPDWGLTSDPQPGTLYTGSCSGTAPWDGSTVAAGLTGPGTAATTDAAPTTVPSPAPTPTPITPRTSPDDDGWSLNDWLLAAVIAVPVGAMLGLGLALYVRRRR